MVGGALGAGDLGQRLLELVAAFPAEVLLRGKLGGPRLDDPAELQRVEPVPPLALA